MYRLCKWLISLCSVSLRVFTNKDYRGKIALEWKLNYLCDSTQQTKASIMPELNCLYHGNCSLSGTCFELLTFSAREDIEHGLSWWTSANTICSFVCKNVTSVCFHSRDQYLFKNRPTDGPPNSFYRSLYPKIIQDIEVTVSFNCSVSFGVLFSTFYFVLKVLLL